MKYLTLLNRYFKGIRILSLVLSFIVLLTLFKCVSVYSEVNSPVSQLSALKTEKGDKIYYFQEILGSATNVTDKPQIGEIVERLAADSRVKNFLGVMTISPVKYGKETLNVLLYSPELLETFPNLKKFGIDFRKNEDGCIIHGYDDILGELKTGDMLNVKVGREEIAIPVSGRVTAPHIHVEMKQSGIPATLDLLFSKSNAIILQATDSVMENIVSHALRAGYQRGFFVEFEDGVTAEEIAEVKATAAPHYSSVLYTMEDMLEASEDSVTKMLKEDLTFPIILLCASIMAYISVIVLTFKRKEKELAMMHLCGGSRIKCASVSFATFTIISLVPIILTSVLIYAWIEFDLGGELYTFYRKSMNNAYRDGTHYLQLYEKATGFKAMAIYSLGSFVEWRVQTLNDLRIDTSCYWILIGFYGMTIVVAFLVTWLSMRKHSPLTYLRGVNE